MLPRPHRFWPALVRTLIGLLFLLLIILLVLAMKPELLKTVLKAVPGILADFPTPGPTPPPPVIAAAAGPLPDGWRAFTGNYSAGEFSCGFLLQLPGGQNVGVNAAHSIPALPTGAPGEFRTATGDLAATLPSQIAHGQTFTGDAFNQDYVIWTVAENAPAEYFLQPDPRGMGQPGERVWVFGRGSDAAGGSKRWPGVVLSSTPEHTWVQLDDAFDPRGYSGCPVISAVTGRVIGMAVAGANQPPVIMGLHPVASLVAKARAALSKGP